MNTVIEGRVAWIFREANFDVDRIVGFAALREHDPRKALPGVMTEFEPDFAAKVRPGDLIVGGANFGFGHPHSPPMALMRRLGVAAVVAHSFAPLYRMGETAAGFPQIACPGILEVVQRWDDLRIDLEAGSLENLRTGATLTLQPPTEHERRLLEAGGLFAWLENTASAPRD